MISTNYIMLFTSKYKYEYKLPEMKTIGGL